MSAPDVLVPSSVVGGSHSPSEGGRVVASGDVLSAHVSPRSDSSSAATSPSTAARRTSPSHHQLPPLPPLSVAFPSPSFSASTASIHNASAASLALAALPPAVLTPSPLHYTPASPVSSSRGGLLLMQSPFAVGPVCSCRNEPGGLPCACTSVGTPLLLPGGLAQSHSVNDLALTAPSSSPPTGFQARSSFTATLPPRALNHTVLSPAHAASSPAIAAVAAAAAAATCSSSSTTPPLQPVSHTLAAMNMVQPSELPTVIPMQSAPLEGINMVATPMPTPASAHPHPHGQGSVVINIFNQPSPQPPPPLNARAINESSFARLSAAHLTRRPPSLSPEFPSSPMSGSEAPSCMNSTASLPTLESNAPEGVSETDSSSSRAQQPSQSPGVPLTASTLRLLRKAIDVLRNMFPSQEDVTKPPPPPLTTETSSSSSSAASTPSRPEGVIESLPPSRGHCCSPNVFECSSTGCAHATTTAALVPRDPIECRCVTRPLICYCGHGLHAICTAPVFSLSSDYLIGGHRGVMSARDCLRSLTQLHNESANIYSHVLGSIWMGSHWIDSKGHWCLRIQALASCALFAMSSIAHTFAPMSREWNDALFRLDRASVAFTETIIAISGALVHFDAPDQRRQRDVLVAINAMLGVAVQRILFKANEAENRTLKVWMLISQGFVVFLPAMLEVSSPHVHPKIKALLGKYILLTTLCGLLGSGLYATFFPESWLHSAEVLENRRRSREATEAARAAGHDVDEIYACSSPNCCAVSHFTPSPSPSPSPDGTSSPAAPLKTGATYMRFLRWFTDHFLHSHHLMHLSVIFCTHYAFMWCARWKFTKLALQAANVTRASIKA